MSGIAGATSGVLTSSEITTLIQDASQAYQAPMLALQNAEKPIETQISALGQVQSSLSSLQSSLSALSDVQSLSQRSVSSSSNVQATATNQAAVGNYSLTDIRLAQAEALLSGPSSSASGSLGSGSLIIQVGDKAATTLDITSSNDTLAGVASAINSAGLGITANVVYNGSAYSLMLTGDSTGTANAFTISGTGGLTEFTYAGGVSGTHDMTEEQAATNASFSFDGLSVTSGSNTIAGVIQGLTITLATSGSGNISVSQNSSALVQAAESVVDSLNSALSTINKFASYSQVSGGGPLLGDVGLQIVRTDLLNAVSNQINPSNGTNAGFTSLGSIGFSVTSGGTVTLDTDTLENATQQNYSAVASLLGAVGVASNQNVGIQSLGSAASGTYAIDVTANSGGTISGTVNGETAFGTGGVMTVVGPGAANGMTLAIAAGLTGNLGSVTVSQGLFGSLSTILNGALNFNTGSVPQEVTDLSNSLSSMNQQISSMQQEAQEETQELTQAYTTAQQTISQLSTVSSFLSSYFKTASG
jgi:flagellar hook-associated protein 2